jgi:GNAT superfamily N-acetyltransferase
MESDPIIRPRQPDDRPAVERICTHTWEGEDYVPQVWDDWLADPQGLLMVGELRAAEGRVVALGKITFRTPDQVWLEGMRADPDFRRRGIAGQFLDYSLAYARDHGARVVRLGTGDHNVAVHILVARAGMERVGTYVLWHAEPLAEGPQPVILATEHAGQVAALLAHSPVLAQAHGLYSLDWTWEELSAERMAQFLADGQVAAQIGPDGTLLALATVHLDPEDRQIWVGYADGLSPSGGGDLSPSEGGDLSPKVGEAQSQPVTELAAAVRAYAGRLGAAKVSIMLPNITWLREAFRSAGYGFGNWEGELWIFENARLVQSRRSDQSPESIFEAERP